MELTFSFWILKSGNPNTKKFSEALFKKRMHHNEPDVGVHRFSLKISEKKDNFQ